MLRSVDISVLLKLTLPGSEKFSFQKLAFDLHIASSEVHGAVKRARVSGLLQHEGQKRVNRSAFFGTAGARHEIRVSAVRGGADKGIAPLPLQPRPLAERHSTIAEMKSRCGRMCREWCAAILSSRSTNMLPRQPWRTLPSTNSLSLADALRDGQVRERKLALEILNKRFFENG